MSLLLFLPEPMLSMLLLFSCCLSLMSLQFFLHSHCPIYPLNDYSSHLTLSLFFPGWPMSVNATEMHQVAQDENPEVVHLPPGTPASNPSAGPAESISSSTIAYMHLINIVYIFFSPRPDHHQLCISLGFPEKQNQ